MAVLQGEEPASARSARITVLLAFGAIYFLWGSTFLAIRVAVATVPPLFSAGVRFAVAGGALYVWSRARGTPAPTRLEWRNVSILGLFMFLLAYGCLFWAEMSLPSGIASVLVATIPIWTALLEVVVLRHEKFHWSLVGSIALGMGGVLVLAFDPHGARLNPLACLAILGGVMSWSLGTVWSKTLSLPESKVISSASQMFAGGFLLLIFSMLAGEMKPWPHVNLKAGLAIGYLIVAGSILGFTAYVWLLGRMPASTVTSYAYVNPVVALLLGHWLGSEALGVRTVIGAALVLGSVLISSTRQADH